jgi:hypothetical protein
MLVVPVVGIQLISIDNSYLFQDFRNCFDQNLRTQDDLILFYFLRIYFSYCNEKEVIKHHFQVFARGTPPSLRGITYQAGCATNGRK